MSKSNNKEQKEGIRDRRGGHVSHEAYAMAMRSRSERIHRYLRLIDSVFSKLFIDDNFITLLRAESMTEVPIYLKPVFEKARRRADEIS